jgi:hypothetical protein
MLAQLAPAQTADRNHLWRCLPVEVIDSALRRMPFTSLLDQQLLRRASLGVRSGRRLPNSPLFEADLEDDASFTNRYSSDLASNSKFSRSRKMFYATSATWIVTMVMSSSRSAPSPRADQLASSASRLSAN